MQMHAYKVSRTVEENLREELEEIGEYLGGDNG